MSTRGDNLIKRINKHLDDLVDMEQKGSRPAISGLVRVMSEIKAQVQLIELENERNFNEPPK